MQFEYEDGMREQIKRVFSGPARTRARIYFVHPNACMFDEKLVPMIEGRSSVGRLGLFVHCTNGFGDVGFSGYWTLEMFAVQPVRVYPGVPICQISYHSISGDVTEYQSDKYQHNEDIQPSLLFKEFQQQLDPQMRLSFGQEVAE